MPIRVKHIVTLSKADLVEIIVEKLLEQNLFVDEEDVEAALPEFEIALEARSPDVMPTPAPLASPAQPAPVEPTPVESVVSLETSTRITNETIRKAAEEGATFVVQEDNTVPQLILVRPEDYMGAAPALPSEKTMTEEQRKDLEAQARENKLARIRAEIEGNPAIHVHGGVSDPSLL